MDLNSTIKHVFKVSMPLVKDIRQRQDNAKLEYIVQGVESLLRYVKNYIDNGNTKVTIADPQLVEIVDYCLKEFEEYGYKVIRNNYDVNENYKYYYVISWSENVG